MSLGAFTIPVMLGVAPKPKGSMKHVGKGRMVEQVKGSKEWRQYVALMARQQYRGRPIAQAVSVKFVVYLPQPKTNTDPFPTGHNTGDVEKHGRNINDALVDAKVLRDDSYVVDIHGSKRWHRPGLPAAHIVIEGVR